MSTTKPTNYPALYTLIGVFFFWGFIAASNGVFIPFAKSYFNLSQFQSQLIDSAFYFAYYIGAFLLFIFSVLGKKDLLNSWGFKSGIVYGLMISVVGAFVMFPALASNSFGFILAALFIIALGFSLQQTAAQPFAISLGDESTGTHRLNLAGGINSFGTTIGPIIFALALLGTTKLDESLIKGLNLSTVQRLYIVVGLAFLAAALLFKFSKKLPDAKADATIENETKATGMISLITLVLVVVLTLIFIQNTGSSVNHDSHMGLYLLLIGMGALVFGLLISNASAAKNATGWGAFKYPQLVLGMLAIFTYVGTEVTIQSNLGEYLKHLDFTNFSLANAGIDYKGFSEMLKNNEVSGHWSGLTPLLISLYWGSLMIGRWAGAISAFNLSSFNQEIGLDYRALCSIFSYFGIQFHSWKFYRYDPFCFTLCRCHSRSNLRILVGSGKTCQNLDDIWIFGHVSHVYRNVYHWKCFSFCLCKWWIIRFGNVAKYFLIGFTRFRKIYFSRISILNHDDFGWRLHTAITRKNSRHDQYYRILLGTFIRIRISYSVCCFSKKYSQKTKYQCG
jgi:fucose permease